MTAYLRRFGEFNKSIVAAIGGVLVTIQAAADVVPGSWSVGVLAALTAASVFLVRNQDRIDRLGDDAADVLDRT